MSLFPDEIISDKESRANLLFVGYFFTCIIEDNGGKSTRVSFQRQAGGGFTEIYNALGDIIAGTITFAIAETRYRPSSFSQPPPEAQVEAKVKLKFLDSVYRSKLHTLYIPSPSPDIFIALSGDGANIVDVECEEILAFAKLFESGEDVYLPGERFSSGIDAGIRVTHPSKRG